MTVRVAVVGATGRMGTLVSHIVEGTEGFELAAGLDSKHELSGMLDADVVVDFSVPVASPSVVDFAVDHGLNVLVGTSGWTSERISSVVAKVGSDPSVGVMIVPNFSLGSVLATRFAATAARYFDSIEIVEAHGASKIDSPSGTAIRTAELMAAAREGHGLVSAPHADQRARGELVAGIPVHSIRLEGVVATQDVLLGGTGEVLTLRHETLASTAYIAGITLALRALPSARGVTVGLESLLDLGTS